MATTFAAQLQAIRNVAQLEAEPHKRPFTRPSIPKEAADLDLDTLLSFALSGLEALATVDNRFGWYKVTLFSHKSRDVDRELMGLEENKSLSASISSYLRLLAGFLNMHSALNTLEYLIRRCKFSPILCITNIQFFRRISSSFLSSKNNNLNVKSQMRLLCEFPSLLVPLASDIQLKMLSLFKRIGSCIMDVDMVRSLLFELLDRRIECSVKSEGSTDKLSPDDIGLLYILLEICASIPKSNAMDTSIANCMPKALQLDHISSDDFAMMKPCVTVLTRLSSAFYDSLGTEMAG